MRNTLKKLKGSYAVVIVNELEPDRLVAARKESPLILGVTESAFFLASDVPAILPYTRQVVYFNDEEVVFSQGPITDRVAPRRHFAQPEASPCGLGPDNGREGGL